MAHDLHYNCLQIHKTHASVYKYTRHSHSQSWIYLLFAEKFIIIANKNVIDTVGPSNDLLAYARGAINSFP